jgi:hypothetical protein
VCGVMFSCNCVANNDVQCVSTNHFYLNVNYGNSSQYDLLIELKMSTY